MFDALKLLGSLAENQSAPSAANRFGAAVQPVASGGLLQQVMAQFGGPGTQQGNPGIASGGPTGPGASYAPSQTQGGLGGMLGNFAEMAQRAAGSPRQELGNNPAVAGGLGALAGALLSGGRGAMGGGLMAVLGSLAYSALQSQGGSGASPVSAAPGMAGAMAPSQTDVQRKATLFIRAMIQAAKADGQVDQQETQRILGKLGDLGNEHGARDFVASEMRRPIDIAGLVRNVTTQQEASEVYAASLMAIEVDTQAERDYMADLARALNLSGPVVAQIHSALGVPT